MSKVEFRNQVFENVEKYEMTLADAIDDVVSQNDIPANQIKKYLDDNLKDQLKNELYKTSVNPIF